MCLVKFWLPLVLSLDWGGGGMGGVLLSDSLMGMWRWMGSHFHDRKKNWNASTPHPPPTPLPGVRLHWPQFCLTLYYPGIRDQPFTVIAWEMGGGSRKILEGITWCSGITGGAQSSLTVQRGDHRKLTIENWPLSTCELKRIIQSLMGEGVG